MIKKSIYLVTLILFLNGCGFTPLYLENRNLNFSISIIDILGDRKVNEAIKSNLQKYNQTDENKKNYEVKINSESIEKIVSKDKKGVISQITLIVKVNFNLKHLENTFKFMFSEEFNIKKTNNIIDNNFYINKVKENMGISISEKLIFEIAKLE